MACISKRRGRFVLDFYDQTGRRRRKTLPKGTTKKEANEILGHAERDVRNRSYTPINQMPMFTDLADIWLAAKEPNIRHSTYNQYLGHLNNHLKPFFGAPKIAHINFEAVEKFKTYSLTKDVTVPTLKKILINLGAILTYAVRLRYIEYNPVRDVEKPKGKSLHSEKQGMNTLKPYEIRELLKATEGDQDRVLFLTAVLTGIRQGELFGLKWDDIDWFNNQFSVRRTYNHGRFYEPKSRASFRRIDLAPELVHELKKWKLACPKSKLDLVFPTLSGTPQQAANMFYRHFLPALRRAKLRRIRFHDLRHTYASLLIAQGEHPKYIQTQMGHSSINVTMDTYGHMMETVNQDAASRLGRAVLGEENEPFEGNRSQSGHKN